jgi:tetratricopeptide (TPR) repeat protein
MPPDGLKALSARSSYAQYANRRVCRRGGNVGDQFFVSYSSVDGSEFALGLADELAAGPPAYTAWVDSRELQPGSEDWDDQVVDAIRGCRAVLFVMTPDATARGSVCKDEWIRALKYKKPVIPLKLSDDVEVPFRLGSRQYIDFRFFDQGLARLRRWLRWIDTPEGVLHELRHRLADASRDLPRAADDQRGRIEAEITDLGKRIAEQQRLVDDPATLQARSSERIQAELEQQRQPAPPPTIRLAKFAYRPPMTAPTWFKDRHVETGLVGDFLRDDALRLMTIVGRGGVGKTAMCCRTLKALERGELPDDLGHLEVHGIVYLSKLSDHAPSFPNLFTGLSELLGPDVARRLGERYCDPQETPAALMGALLDAFPQGRTVVLLDNVEDVIDPATFGIADSALDEALRKLLTAAPHGVKVLITTRLAPNALQLCSPGVQRRLDLSEGLASPYAEQLLRALDDSGDLGVKHADDELLREARHRTGGNPRALELLVASLSADRNTSLTEVLTVTERYLPDEVMDVLVGEAFSRLDALDQQVMQGLAVFNTPVPAVALDYLLDPYRAAVDSAPVLGRLVNMNFVRRDAGRYYLHQVDRAYALRQIPKGGAADREAEAAPFTQLSLRARAAHYFASTRTAPETWRTLEDLTPQLEEFELRWQGEDYGRAADLLFSIDFNYLMVWGHSALVVDLHERLQGVLDEPWQWSASLTNLGTCYFTLGQTDKAIDHYVQAVAIYREIHNPQGEAADLIGLGNCYFTLGQTDKAIDHYVQAVAIYREIHNPQGEAASLTNLGNSYFTLGQTDKAIELHTQALAIHREIGYRRGEAIALGNLGDCREAQGSPEAALRQFEAACRIADEVRVAQMQAEARVGIAETKLALGDTAGAQRVLDVGKAIPYPPAQPLLLVLEGMVALRQYDLQAARSAFEKAVVRAGEQLENSHSNLNALDAKALALSGLTLAGSPERAGAAVEGFRAARAASSAPGTVAVVARRLDLLPFSEAQAAALLVAIREAATRRP